MTVTWDEVSWAVRRFLGNEIALLEGRSFLNLPRLKLLTVDSEVILKARELAERDGLKPRDAIHADAAMRNGIRELMSYDAGFDAEPGIWTARSDSVFFPAIYSPGVRQP